MASPCEVHLADVDEAVARRAVELVAAEAHRIETKYSRYRDGNVVHAINSSRGAAVAVDDETARLIDYAAALFELSDGKFDVTSGVLRRVWTFDGSDRIPKAADVAALLPIVGWRKVQWRSPEIALRPGMEIDFGGIGKEYAVDRAAALVRPVTKRCLLNFGGDLLALGPSAGERPWCVGIESLEDATRAVRQLEISCGALATSGDARRFLLRKGRRYSHILDPATGWPVCDAPRSVTVAAATCTEAGMLATLALLRGRDAEAFLDAQGAQYWVLR